MRHLLLVCCLTVSLAQAETYVITAGVEKYDDERISSLKYANADAKSVAQAFRGSGVPRQNVTLLTTDETDGTRRPTRGNLLRALQNARQRAVAGDKLVFYFAGHGIEQEGEHYLLTVDTQVDLVQDMSLPMRLVNKALDGLQAGEVLFILDACRNDPQKGRSDTDAKMTDGLARGLRPQFKPVGAVPKPRVVATLLACDAGERAWEDPEAGHGVFTLYLAKGLSGQAAKDGRVTLSGLAAYVQQQVGLWAARAKRTQTPKLQNADGGDMVLLVPPAEPLVSVSFQNETLARVVEMVAQQYGVQIVLGRGVDAQARVTGRLENLPLSTTLKALLAAHKLTVRREDGVCIIEAQADPPAASRPKAWHIDEARRFVDRAGQLVVPVMVAGQAEARDASQAQLVAAGLHRAGVDAVTLHLTTECAAPGTGPLRSSEGATRMLDNLVPALGAAGVKVVLVVCVRANDADREANVTKPDSPFWRDEGLQSDYLGICEALATRSRQQDDTVVAICPFESSEAPDLAGYADLVSRAVARIRAADPAMPVIVSPPIGAGARWLVPAPANGMTGGEEWPDAKRLEPFKPGGYWLWWWGGIDSRSAQPDLSWFARFAALSRARQLQPCYYYGDLAAPPPGAFAAYRQHVQELRAERTR